MKKIIMLVLTLLVFSSFQGYAAETDFPDWDFKSSGKGAEVTLTYDSSKVKAGEAAMCIVPDSNTGEFTVSQKVSTEPGSEYEFVANVIGTKISDVSIEASGESKKVRNGTSSRYTLATAYKVTWEATGTECDVSLIIAGDTEAVYADEFALYKDGDTTVNLLKNPGFEEGIDKTAPQEITNPETTEGDGRLTLRWTDPEDDDLDKIIITRLDENGEKTDDIYEVEKGIGKLEINGLEEWTGYTYLIQTKDNTLGNISEGTKITATTRGITYIANDYVVETNKVSITVKNIAEDEFTAELAVLSYDADGKMVKAVSSTKQPVSKGESLTLNTDYEIPEGGYAKVFLWNGVYSMRCLKPSIKIN